MSCANLKVVVFFLSEISSRGAKVPVKMYEYIIKFKALPIFCPKGIHVDFQYFIPDTLPNKMIPKRFDVIFCGFDQQSELSYQPMSALV